MTRRQALTALLSLAPLRPKLNPPAYRHSYSLRFLLVDRTVKCTRCWDHFTLAEACRARRLRASHPTGPFHYLHDCPRCGVARATFFDTAPAEGWFNRWYAHHGELCLTADQVSFLLDPITGRQHTVWRVPDGIRGVLRAGVEAALGFYPKAALRATCLDAPAVLPGDALQRLRDYPYRWEMDGTLGVLDLSYSSPI